MKPRNKFEKAVLAQSKKTTPDNPDTDKLGIP